MPKLHEMTKRYNLQLVEMESKKVILETELVYTIEPPNSVFIDNPIHTTFVQLENAIARDQKDD